MRELALVSIFLLLSLTSNTLAATGKNSTCDVENIQVLASADITIDYDTVTFYRFKDHVISYIFVSNVTVNGSEDTPCVKAVVSLDVDETRCKGVVQFVDGDPYYRQFELNLENSTYNVTVRAVQLGSCLVDATVTGEDSQGRVEVITDLDVLVHVIRAPSPLDAIFQLLMMTLVIFGNIAMGLKTDISVVKESLKRPVGPAIALGIQFIIQPVVAFALINIFSIYPEIVAFGFFIVGCSPSGTASNFHTFLLGGDVSLAVTVTLCSTILSLGAYPLWIYTLGTYIMSSSPRSPSVPFEDIVLTLAEAVVPVIIGLIIKAVKPAVAVFLLKWIVQPYLACIILYMVTAGIYTNVYLFEVVSWQVLLAGCMLPYVGFGIGYVVAYFAKQSPDRRIAIMIESGLQNVYIPIFMLKQTFDQPDSDLASVGPLGALLLGPIPLYFAELFILFRTIYNKSEKLQKCVDKLCCCCCPGLLMFKHEPLNDNEASVKAEGDLTKSVNASVPSLSALAEKLENEGNNDEPQQRSKSRSNSKAKHPLSRKASNESGERQPLLG